MKDPQAPGMGGEEKSLLVHLKLLESTVELVVGDSRLIPRRKYYNK